MRSQVFPNQNPHRLLLPYQQRVDNQCFQHSLEIESDEGPATDHRDQEEEKDIEQHR